MCIVCSTVFLSQPHTSLSLYIFQFDEKRADMPLTEDSKLDKGDMISFIHTNSMKLVIPFNEEVKFTSVTNETSY